MMYAFIHLHTQKKLELLLCTKYEESKNEENNQILSVPNKLIVKWEVGISNQTLASTTFYEREVKNATRISRRNT